MVIALRARSNSGSSQEGQAGPGALGIQELLDREHFLGALHITNGVGTSCGWRNGDGARLGCAPKAQLPPSPGALLGPRAMRGTGLLSGLAGA